MLQLSLTNPRSILCLGAHSDDIEIGCGGTLLRLLREHPGLHVDWVVLSATPARVEEARRSADLFLKDAGSRRVRIEQFRDSYFPYQGAQIKEFFEGLRREVSPDVVFTHRLEDRHQDHRLVAELTWCALRNHLILEYEIPKYEGDLGHPNVYVPLSKEDAQHKVDHLLSAFPSQREKPWFTADTFAALLRLRGVECHAQQHMAEAFHCRKAVL